MKKQKKRVISILLTMLVTLSGLPFMGMIASAADYSGRVENTSVQWRLETETWTLYLSANGVMPSCDFAQSIHNAAPSVSLDSIRHVVIEEGTTAIRAYGVTYVLHGAQTIQLPKSLCTFDPGVFNNCFALMEFIVHEENPIFKGGHEGAVYSKDGKMLMAYPTGRIRVYDSVIVPDGVECIGKNVFDGCPEMKAVTLPKSLKMIEEYAFNGCCGLESMTLPEGVQMIGDHALYHTKSLQSLNIPSALQTLGSEAFGRTEGLRTFTGGENNDVFSVSGGVLFSEDGTTLIQYPAGNEQSAYTVPEGVTAIESHAFDYAAHLQSITFPTTLLSMGQWCAAHCVSLTSVSLPSVQSMQRHIFAYDSALREVILPEGLETMDTSVFFMTPALERVHLPSTLQSIHPDTFRQVTCTICVHGGNALAEQYTADHDLALEHCGGHDDQPHTYTCTVTCEATCGAEGERTYMCSCGKTYTESIPRIAHDWNKWEPLNEYDHIRVCKVDAAHTQIEAHHPQTLPDSIGADGEAVCGGSRCADCGYIFPPVSDDPGTIPNVDPESGGDIDPVSGDDVDPEEGVIPESDPDPTMLPTEEDLAALQAAIDALPDPQQLYYYKDEAILNVADALGNETQDAEAFLREAKQNGYAYAGANTRAAVAEAKEKLTLLMSNGNDPYMLNAFVHSDGKTMFIHRDESKAHLTIRTIPVSVNGEAVNYRKGPVSIRAGDQVQFNLYIDTDYYVSSMTLPIVYDAVHFIPMDREGNAYEPEQLADVYLDDVVELTVASAINHHYDTEVLSVMGYARQYPTAYRTPDIMGRYKILAIMCGSKYARTSVVLKMDSAQYGSLLNFTMLAKEDMLYSADNACVGCVADWYPQAGMQDDLFFSVSRAAGYLEDGVTPASSFNAHWVLYRNRENTASACMIADLYAKYGQSCVCEPDIQIAPHEHTWGEPEIVRKATCCAEGVVCYTCTACGKEKTGTIPVDPNAHRWNAGEVTIEPTAAAEGEMTYTCLNNPAHTMTEAIPAVQIEKGLLVLQSGEAIRGQSVSVTVEIRDNPGVTGILLELDYDPAILTLTKVEDGSVFEDGAFTGGSDLSAIPFTVLWVDARKDLTRNGTLVTFTFAIAPDAPLGKTTVSVSYDPDNIHNTELNNVPFLVQNAEVDVTLMFGDADNDGIVTLKDAALMRRYLAGWDVEIHEETSDAYRDGAINLKDVTWIIRSLLETP